MIFCIDKYYFRVTLNPVVIFCTINSESSRPIIKCMQEIWHLTYPVDLDLSFDCRPGFNFRQRIHSKKVFS